MKVIINNILLLLAGLGFMVSWTFCLFNGTETITSTIGFFGTAVYSCLYDIKNILEKKKP